MASAVRKSKMKEVALSKVKDDLSRFLREAETRDVGFRAGRGVKLEDVK